MIVIPRHLIETHFSRSGGAGGQHVNKTETKAEIRFEVDTALWIPERVRLRFKRLAERWITDAGIFHLHSDKTRSQHRNLEDCFARLGEILAAAEVEPRIRRKTKPTRSSKEKRLSSKKISGDRKRNRSKKNWD